MNRIFKVIWNQILQRWVVASELSTNRHKARRSNKIALLLAGILAITGVPMAMADYGIEENPQPAFVDGKIETIYLNGNWFSYETTSESVKNLPAGKVEIGSIIYGEEPGSIYIQAANNIENPQIIKINSIKNPTKSNGSINLEFYNGEAGLGSEIDHSKLMNHLIIESDIGVPNVPSINDDAITLEIVAFDNVKLQNINGTGAIDFYGINKLEMDTLTSYKEFMSGHSRVILEDIHELKMGKLYLDGIESFNLQQIGQGEIEELKIIDSNYLTIEESKLNIENIKLAVVNRFYFTTPLLVNGTEEFSTEIINNKLDILGGASLILGSNSHLYSQDINLSEQKHEYETNYDTLSIGESGSSDSTTVTARNITLNQYATLGVNQSAISTEQQGETQVTRLNLNVTDTLFLGNDVAFEQHSADRRSVMRLDDSDEIEEIFEKTDILDLTTIHHLHLAGGYIEGLEGDFQTKLNHFTFEDITGGQLHIQDLSLLGNGRFEIAAGAPEMLAEDQERSQLRLDKLTVESDASAHFIAGQRKGEASKDIAYFTTDESTITLKPKATLMLSGHHDFNMVKTDDYFTPTINGEAERAVMQLNTEVKAADHTTIRGNGYIANTLTLGDGAHLYVGNAYENSHWGEKGIASRNSLEPTYGHLAVDRLVIEAGKRANLHFSLAAGGEKADLLTILQSASGEGNVYVSPVMSPTLTADAEGKVLIVDVSNIADADNSLNLTLAKPVSRGLYEY